MQDLSERYPVWFCDVWGVVHNGVSCFPDALDALARHRARGGLVLLLTNAPRPRGNVEAQLKRLGGGPETYDLVVTSGDVTLALLAQHHGGKVHHIGPERDLSIFDGSRIQRVRAEEAEVILCTGLLDDTVETPEDYRSAFKPMIARRLEMICANPDLVVRRGDTLVYCAGALARLYAEMGGETLLAGKPYAPIYDLALAEAARIARRAIAKSEVLAIGDGPDTDIRGAAENGFDALLIGGGIHEPGTSLDELTAEVKARSPNARIVRALESLAWS